MGEGSKRLAFRGNELGGCNNGVQWLLSCAVTLSACARRDGACACTSIPGAAQAGGEAVPDSEASYLMRAVAGGGGGGSCAHTAPRRRKTQGERRVCGCSIGSVEARKRQTTLMIDGGRSGMSSCVPQSGVTIVEVTCERRHGVIEQAI